MEILLKTKNTNDIIDLVQSLLEEEFFSLIEMYECSIPEMDYWIKSQIIDRLSDSSVHLINDRFFEPGGNLINDSICVFIKAIDDCEEEFEYLVVESEKYVDQNPEIRDNNYKDCWLDYDKAFELFRNWAYNYINDNN